MPKNLSSTGDAFPTQTSPQAGEPRTAGSVETPFQNAADRTAYLKSRLDYVDPTKEGVRRLRSVSSIGALQAVTDRPHGTVVQVDGVGLYQFDGANIDAEQTPFVVKPTDVVHPAPGRWIGHLRGMLNVPNGIPQLNGDAKLPGNRLSIADANGRVEGANVVFGTKNVVVLHATALFNIPPDQQFYDVPNATAGLTLAVGDLVLIDYNFLMITAPNKRGQARIRIETPTSTIDELAMMTTASASANVDRYHFGRHFAVTTAGDHYFKLQALSLADGDSSSVRIDDVYTRVLVLRP